jgi:hypothetical protein
LKKEILSDDFKKRKIFWKNIAENFLENVPPHITKSAVLRHVSKDHSSMHWHMTLNLVASLLLYVCFTPHKLSA